MARSHFRYTVGDVDKVIQGARVYLYETGTTTALTDAYNALTGGSLITYVDTNSQGEVEFWKTTPATIDIKVTDNSDTAYYPDAVGTLLSFADRTETVEVHPRPDEVALTANVVTLAGVQTITGAKTFEGIADFDTHVRFKTRPWVDVTHPDFGALGDGATDDIVAIEAASAVITANPRGGVLYFPPGIYMISRMWTPPPRAHLLGVLNNSTIRLMAGFTWGAIVDNGGAIDLSTPVEVLIENLVFDTAAATLPNPTAANQTAVIHVNGNTHFRHVDIRNVKSAGASKIWGMKHVAGGSNVYAHQLRITSCDRGLHVRGIGQGFYESCYFGNCTGENLGLSVNNDAWDFDGRLSFSHCLIDETFGSSASCEIGTTVTDVTFDQCLFFGSQGTPSLRDAGTRNVYTACRFQPFGSNTGNIALSISSTEITFIGCFVESSPGQVHVRWDTAGAKGLFLGCTFGVGTGFSGPGTDQGTFVSRADGVLTIATSPLAATRKIALTRQGYEVTDSNGVTKWSTSFDEGNNRWGVGESGVANRFQIDAGTGMIRISNHSATTVGAAGAANALPANPTGYLIVNIGGTDRKIPFYAT